jgi:hypothetical protein
MNPLPAMVAERKGERLGNLRAEMGPLAMPRRSR